MNNITLPEIILRDTLKAAIDFVRRDYADKPIKTDSYLFMLLSGARMEKYDFFTQAIEVICGSADSQRFLDIDLMFNRKRETLPSVHITLPSEMTGQGNGMGTDEGYVEQIIEGTKSRAVFSRRITATYNVVIMSDNTNEVILLYHFIRGLMVALIPHLHIKGLSNVSFGGQDLQPYSDLANDLHMRAITINLQYDLFVPSIFPQDIIIDIEANGLPKV